MFFQQFFSPDLLSVFEDQLFATIAPDPSLGIRLPILLFVLVYAEFIHI